MKSSLYERGLREGRQEALDAERDTCLEVIRELHPTLAARAFPVIQATSDPGQLKRWIVLAARSSSDDLAQALGLVH
jgi:hypothetical protein